MALDKWEIFNSSEITFQVVQTRKRGDGWGLDVEVNETVTWETLKAALIEEIIEELKGSDGETGLSV